MSRQTLWTRWCWAVTLVVSASATGTEVGTPILVKDINARADPEGSSPSELEAVGSKLYFAAVTRPEGEALWRSDGTEAGTTMVEDLYVGWASSSPSNLCTVGETLFFAAADALHDRELWSVALGLFSDGFESGDTSRWSVTEP